MEINVKEVDCIFFQKLQFPHNKLPGSREWEPGCILKDYFCTCAFEKAEPCSNCVSCSDRNKICQLVEVCLQKLGFASLESEEAPSPEQEAER